MNNATRRRLEKIARKILRGDATPAKVEALALAVFESLYGGRS